MHLFEANKTKKNNEKEKYPLNNSTHPENINLSDF